MDKRIQQVEAAARSMASSLRATTGLAVSLEYNPGHPLEDFIDPKLLRLFKFGLFAEQEMLRASEAGAFFAACLSGAAMNESVMSMLCLVCKEEVIGTKQYASSKLERKLRNKSFEQVISYWNLQQFINVARELNWIYSEIIRDEIKSAFAAAYRELMAVKHPEKAKSEVEEIASSFFGADAGGAILTFTQEIRNLIHASKWLRDAKTFDGKIFGRWCQFSVLVFAEVRTCLIHKLSTVQEAQHVHRMDLLSQQVAAMEPQTRAEFLKQICAGGLAFGLRSNCQI